MKNRNIPFGYEYQNGTILRNKSESEVVREIYREYLDGQSLLQIAKSLTEKKTEYAPGIAVWNKPKIMRILDDQRYLGNEKYPQIIDGQTHRAVKAKKEQKSNLTDMDWQAEIYRLKIPVLCPVCGATLCRRNDPRCLCKQRWYCKNKECRVLIPITDEELLQRITDCLNAVIADPSQIQTPPVGLIEPSPERMRLQNEIARDFEENDIKKENLKRKILQIAELRYREIGSEEYIAKKCQRDFDRAEKLTAFSAELTEKTVDQILLYRDGSVNLLLKNGQIIPKEADDDADSNNPNDAA